MTVRIQSQNLKFSLINLRPMRVWSSERTRGEMDNTARISHYGIIEALAVDRYMQFFIGWMKRFGYISSLFSFPLKFNEHAAHQTSETNHF